MPANSWPENDSYNDLDPLNSLLSELAVEDDSLETRTSSVSSPYRFKNRRRKAAIALTIVWSSTIALHLLSFGSSVVLGLTTLLGIHAFLVVFTRPRTATDVVTDSLPFVSILVSAKNEEAVIGNLVENLCNLKYPQNLYEVWMIDDGSSDGTAAILSKFAQKYQHLKILRRSANAGGGKSGALNQVLPLTKGEIIAVFDADAQVPLDTLTQVVPLFSRPQIGAVQMRKAIANAPKNFWTKGQMAEMAVDTYLQYQRTCIGGIGELRGNGQFVRRQALESFGGWNEETITDDLDLTMRLHLNGWDIECVFHPAVQEEGVTNAIALWHQRNRWAEGGYQRYLDYWDLILKNRMGGWKTWDMFLFMLMQYLLPTAAIPDLLMAAIRHRPPMLVPVTSLAFTMSMTGMAVGLARIQRLEARPLNYFAIALQTLRGTLYMLHWVVVMGSTTARMCIFPKKLKWVKTVHQGSQLS
ncbi:glycosyltransferase [Calothrix sp. NIES-3974]|uniref:glycosyltransferase n=1 Tax=Calothrix sp. NIES-3974 TaxID=2005462 RepID=UPI000B6008F9|nr:glycosyltransferase family 2 protein [Calothrix sp. NIES-3974]BAZ03642.1 glycosyl transferase family protein [Calothrix sp. NIES-3974]